MRGKEAGAPKKHEEPFTYKIGKRDFPVSGFFFQLFCDPQNGSGSLSELHDVLLPVSQYGYNGENQGLRNRYQYIYI